MSVSYKPIARRNPSDPTAPELYYATIVKKGEVDLDQLAHLLGKGATMRRADVFAVLEGLIEEIQEALTNGRTVKLGGIGSFSLGVNSTGVSTPEEVHSGLIIRRKIIFRPGKKLRKTLDGLDFEKA